LLVKDAPLGGLVMSRRWVAGAVIGIAVLAVTGCGSTPAPGGGQGSPPGSTTVTSPSASGPLRPVTSQPRAADGALECPATIASSEGMTVPQRPQGVDGYARLLPERPASSMVVCGYPVMDIMATKPLAAPFRLSTRTVATAEQRAAVTDLLAWAPRWTGEQKICTAMAGNETAYLVGAVYDGAVVWVAAKADANSCSNSTNGDFTSGAALGVPLDAMFGGQPARTPAGPCAGTSFGRLGDDRSLAPEGDPNVLVCRLTADGRSLPTRLDAARSSQVVALLRSLQTRPTQHACRPSGTASSRFALWLTYAAGPGVRIEVDPQCVPQVLGSSLEAADAGNLVTLVDRWSPPVPGPDPDGSVSSAVTG
jgi:hypothetical protein